MPLSPFFGVTEDNYERMNVLWVQLIAWNNAQHNSIGTVYFIKVNLKFVDVKAGKEQRRLLCFRVPSEVSSEPLFL